MKLIITGGFGYIGSNIAKHLISKGHEVIILDYLDKPINDSGPDCASQKCDITILEELESIKVKNVDAVLHLAAQSSGPNSIKIPEKDIQVNILGTLNIIKWCQINNINKILFASSFVVYGDNAKKEKVRENDYCNPKSIYALSKHYCEGLLKIYAKSLGVNWNILRMFNVYGPGQDLSRDDQGMVSIFLQKVISSDFVGVKGRLDRFRDFIYIDDIVEGWELCLLDQNNINQIFNLGSGIKTHLSTIIDIIIKACSKDGDVVVKEICTTPGDIMGSYADISKISKKLGYNPKTDLKTGIDQFVQWALTAHKI